MKSYKLFNESLGYLATIIIWIIIFGKFIFSQLFFVDYSSPMQVEFFKFLQISDYNYPSFILELPKLLLYPFSLTFLTFQFAILILMLMSFYFIKKSFYQKGNIFIILFSIIYFFNPFVYSRIMVGQLGVIASYLLIPMVYYCIEKYFSNGFMLKDNFILALAVIIASSFSVHFIGINMIIFLTYSFFYFLENEHINKKKFMLSSVIFLMTLILLGMFIIQGIFSNKIFSAIDSFHSDFFSPKLSLNLPAVSKIIGMWGFWREAGYNTTFGLSGIYFYYLLLFLLLACLFMGYYFEKEKKRKIFITLFWIGLILGTGISHPYIKPIFDNFFKNIPFFNGYRDSHKFVSLICFSLSYFLGSIAEFLENKRKRLKILLLFILIAFILIYTYPLINLGNQVKDIKYPYDYIEAGETLDNLDYNGEAIYLPWETYLTYSWTIGNLGDGRISVPINELTNKKIEIGSDKWGDMNKETIDIRKCLDEKSLSCIEDNQVSIIILDKCSQYNEDFSWISKTNSSQVLNNSCIEIYKTNYTGNLDTKIPLRFIIGTIISIITLIFMLIYIFFKKKKHSHPVSYNRNYIQYKDNNKDINTSPLP